MSEPKAEAAMPGRMQREVITRETKVQTATSNREMWSLKQEIRAWVSLDYGWDKGGE